jgi:hypothetical protein
LLVKINMFKEVNFSRYLNWVWDLAKIWTIRKGIFNDRS